MEHSKTSDAAVKEGTANPEYRPRVDFSRVPGVMHVMGGLETFARQSGLEDSLLELVRLRASLMNGCAYCIDMHTKDARLAGESEQRLYAVPVWRETPFFTARERTALAWTEAVTAMAPGGVPDDLYETALREFGEQPLVHLTMAIVAINGWNRLSVSFHAPVGQYVAGSVARTFAARDPGQRAADGGAPKQAA
jgi:AhpD family alkylhydroperoxidase